MIWKRLYCGADKIQNLITLVVTNLPCTWSLIELKKMPKISEILDTCKTHVLRVFEKSIVADRGVS